MLRTVICLLALAGCSPAPMPISRASNDPSNPSAPEGLTPPVARAPVPAASGYVCPMHPEVTSPHEGTCPKCSMKLVPKG